ncbi:MAG: AAA family ATPase [Myxococcota bacterium]
MKLLGGLDVHIDGAPVAIPTRKAGLVLARLALVDSGATRTQLTALLWGDRNERQARGSLRQALFALRKAMAPAGDALEVSGDRLRLAPTTRVDAREAERLARSSDTKDLLRLRELYAGPLLEGTELETEFREWLEPVQSKLFRDTLDALRRLLRIQLETGDAQQTAERIASLDPTCEECHRALMHILAHKGDRSGALKVFERLRERLSADLQVEPEPETARMAAMLRKADRTWPTPGPSLALPAPDRTPAPKTDPRERRHVAALFVRVATPAHDDPEFQHDQDLAFVSAVESVVRRRRGTLRRVGSGRSVALFGVPRAYGDEAGRAALAAHEILQSIPDACIGGAVGDVVAEWSLEDGQLSVLTGTPVDRAEQIAIQASPGAFWAELGLKEEAELRQDLDVRPIAPDLVEVRSCHERSDKTPFTGRKTEVAQIEVALETARSEHRGRVIYIRGEAGIGKTRLAWRLAERAADQGYVSHIAYVLDYGGETRRDALRNLMRRLCGLFESDDAIATELAVERVRSELEPDDEAFLRSLLDAPLPPRLAAYLDALNLGARQDGLRRVARMLVRWASRAAPLVLVVEDVHWADPDTVHALGDLCEVVKDTSTLFVITSRLEADPFDAALRGRLYGIPITTVDLGPLSPPEVSELARNMGASPAIVEQVAERAAGHPLFLEQLLKHGSSTDAKVPASVRSLVQARLDQLEVSHRETLQAASVLGQRFTLEALTHLLSDGRVDMDALLRSGLVRTSGGAYSFAHALLCDAVYGSLLTRRRRELHREAAQWFDHRDLELAAEHYERAQDERAPAAYERAAENLRRSLRTQDALRICQKGLSLARGSDWTNLTNLLGEIHLDLGDMTKAREAFEAVLSSRTEDDGRARAWLGRAGVRRITDDLVGARKDVDAAEEVARQSNLQAEVARAHFLRGNLLFFAGDVKGCLRAHEQSLELARQIGRRDLEAAALGGIGDAQYLGGDMVRAVETLAACVELARTLGLGRIEVANLSQIADASVFLLPLHEAAEQIRSARAASARVGALRAELNATAGQAWADFHRGFFHECSQVVEEAHRLVRRLGAYRYDQMVRTYRGAVTCVLSSRVEGLKLLNHAADFAESSGPGFHGAEAYGFLARFGVNEDARRAAIRRGEEIIRAGSVGHSPLMFYPLAARAALDIEDFDLADVMLNRLQVFTGRPGLPFTQAHIDLFRAALSARRGQLSESERDLLEDALQSRLRALDLAIADEVPEFLKP